MDIKVFCLRENRKNLLKKKGEKHQISDWEKERELTNRPLTVPAKQFSKRKRTPTKIPETECGEESLDDQVTRDNTKAKAETWSGFRVVVEGEGS